ncbi:MAG: hypothetical protein O2854_07955 [Chloroflexi bacterium]|nr:hypothetical protein [Chloroflexota bacterium]
MLTVIVTQVVLKVLDPEFYKEQLVKTNAYEFLLTDLVTTVVEDARRLPAEDFTEQLDENPIVLSGLSTEEIVASFNAMAPPEWVQQQVEEIIDQIGGYAVGTRDGFVLEPRLGEQATIIVDEAQQLLLDADVYNLIFQQVIDPFVEESIGEQAPLGIEFSSERLSDAVHKIITPNWLAQQVNDAIDETTPYFTGQSDEFELRIDLADRVPIAQAELKALLRDEDAYEVLFSEVVEPQIASSLGELVTLPEGITLTRAEVTAILRAVAPPEWVQIQVEALIDAAVEYILGQTDTFSIEISLAENKLAAAVVLEELAEQKLDELFMTLPDCTTSETIEIATDYATAGGLPGIPPCLPAEDIISREDLRAAIPLDLSDAVNELVLGQLPDSIAFDETLLRDQFGGSEEGNSGSQSGNGSGNGGGETNPLERLDQIREYVQEGFTYSSDDLREDFGEDVARLDDVREILSDEWSYTHEDLRQDIFDSGGQEALDRFDLVRDNLKLARQLSWLLYLILALVLVMIGFLGGRRWRSRFMWAAAPLVLFGLILVIAFGPVYSWAFDSYATPKINELFRGNSDNENNPGQQEDQFFQTTTLAKNKLLDVAEVIPGTFTTNIRNFGLIMLVIGLVMILGAFFWPKASGGRPRPRAPTPTPAS